MRPTLVRGGVVVGVVALSAFAQAPNALTQGPAAPFRTDIRLVQVNVVVQDKAGRPVSDLTRADFTLFEDGKEQPIELFSVVSDQTKAPLPAIAAGDFSNRLDGRAGGAVTVILFDRLNMRLQDQRQARDQIVKALEQIRHEDRVALYLLDSTSVQILHDFTNDSASLLSAFSKQVGRGRPEPDAPPAELAMLQGFLLGAAQNTSNVLFQNRVETTANALEAVANRLAGVRGRKNLVWVSSGFPFVYGGHFETATMQEAADRATRARTRLTSPSTLSIRAGLS
jgi:VWFA-related protein